MAACVHENENAERCLDIPLFCETNPISARRTRAVPRTEQMGSRVSLFAAFGETSPSALLLAKGGSGPRHTSPAASFGNPTDFVVACRIPLATRSDRDARGAPLQVTNSRSCRSVSSNTIWRPNAQASHTPNAARVDGLELNPLQMLFNVQAQSSSGGDRQRARAWVGKGQPGDTHATEATTRDRQELRQKLVFSGPGTFKFRLP